VEGVVGASLIPIPASDKIQDRAVVAVKKIYVYEEKIKGGGSRARRKEGSSKELRRIKSSQENL
jgi:hypothetical protein